MSVRDERRGAPTIPDVARAAGVSTATAARALGNYGTVGAATREKVLRAARELGYRVNGLARSMITGSTNTIGVVLSDIENPFFSRALRGIADTAHEAGFEVVLTNTDEDPTTEARAVRVLGEKRVDGLLVCPALSDVSDHLAGAVDARIPLVLFDRRANGVAADMVGISNRAATRDATEHLIGLGHRRIALLTGGDPVRHQGVLRPGLRGVERLPGTTTGERAAGYRDALVHAGIAPDLDLVSLDGFHRADGVAATKRLLALPRPPTAILALDSLLSIGALQAFRELGLTCPDDVSLIGFDDADWTEVVSPPLTVVAQPVYEIGVRACELLLRRIRGDAGKPATVRLSARLVERGSTAPPPRR